MATDVATTKTQLPAALAKRMAEDAGKGVSTAQEDNIVPLIYILQPLSPQVLKTDPAYIQGAEAGDILLRNANDPIVKGAEGIIFQPCFFTKDWVEWVPRGSGGGYVGRHADRPTEAKETRDPKNPNKVKYVMPNGNEVIETRYHVGFVLRGKQALPFVIPLTSTGHTVSRQWMFTMNSQQLPDGKKAPVFACLYRIKTRMRSNVDGSWFTPDISNASEDGQTCFIETEADYLRGFALHEAFASGASKAAVPDGPEAEGGKGAELA